MPQRTAVTTDAAEETRPGPRPVLLGGHGRDVARFDGTFLLCTTFVPGVVSRGSGRVVNVASSTFWLDAPSMTAHIASKAAIIGLTRSLASEVGSSGVM